MKRTTAIVIIVVMAIGLALTSLQVACAPLGPPVFRAEPWADADTLFRRDPRWVGGDGAYSIDLGQGRVLWLFGDSVIDPTASHSRKSPGATMVSNTVAIQWGYDPSKAEIQFFWRTAADGQVGAFFPDQAPDRHWPGHGIRIGDRLILFLMQVRSVPTGLGFEVRGWSAVMIRNPDADPPEWDMVQLEAPQNELQVIVGSAGVLRHGGYVYAYGSQEPGGRNIYLARWREQDLHHGELGRLEWWSERGWVEDGLCSDRATPVMRDGATEFTVHRDNSTGGFIQIQAVGFGPADVSMRWSRDLAGPWPDAVRLYRPPEYEKSRIMIYQGKAHQHLTGAELILTYCTNSFEFQNLLDDASVYYPRFVRISRRRPNHQ